MKFSVEKDVLIAGLQQVINVVGNKLTMPILSNVLIEAFSEKNQIALSTTNLDIGIRCIVAAQVKQSGSVTLPVKKLSSIVKVLPAKEVEFDSENDESTRIASGGSHFKIPGLPVNDFPRLPSLSEGQKIEISQVQFVRMLKCVSYAQSKDENRYILNGVYFTIEDGRLNFVATDGRRLASISNEISVCKLQQGVIVPAKTIAELERTLGVGENVRILMADQQIAFLLDVEGLDGVSDAIYIVSKIVEGKYPNYKQVIPSTSDHRVRLDRERLLSVIQRIALVSDEKNYSIRLKFEENNLRIAAKSPAYGEANETLSIVHGEGTVEMAFNPQFLADPLKVLTTDEVYFEFKNELCPGVIKNNDSFLCVVMPLRLN